MNNVKTSQEFSNRAWLPILLTSILAVTALFLFEGNKGLGLSDEGFLWYGVQRVMEGEVPLRDFQSYDPGRYYLSAAIMTLFGSKGLIALRVSISALQFVGLAFGLWLIAGTFKKLNVLYLVGATVVLLLWMRPFFKIYDISISIFLLGILTRLVQTPSFKNFFIAGLGVGLAAFFGRNHGLYGAAGCFGVIVWLNLGEWQTKSGYLILKEFLICAFGVLMGFMPILLMMASVPNFGKAFIDSVLFLFEVKQTNLFIGIPLPWHLDGLSGIGVIRKVFFSLIFLGVLFTSLLAVLWLSIRKRKLESIPAVLVAASFLALPYFHHAYSRADLDHLPLGIFPFLIGMLAFVTQLPTKMKWASIGLGIIISFTVMLDTHRGWKYFISDDNVTVNVSGSEITVTPEIARSISIIRKLAQKHALGNQEFLVAPYWPGAYALLESKAPIWETYILFKRSESFEIQEVERLRKSNLKLALIQNRSYGGPELLFKNNRPIIYQFIQSEFVRVETPGNDEYELFLRKDISNLN